MKAPAFRFDALPARHCGSRGGMLGLNGVIRRRRPAVRLLAILLLTLAAPCRLSPAEIYKWVDANGDVHYGDQPPDTGAESVHVPGDQPDVNLEQRLVRRQRLLDVLEEERERHKLETARQNDMRLTREANCRTATGILNAMLDSAYLYEKTADPYNPKILTLEERDAAIERASRDVANWCGGD
jgi:hypothetical protein